MNINRHNYEEYFLLYIDNELNVDQKKQVELFVKENPDVEEELVMLQQSRLIPDNTIVFDKKHLLMKEENDSPINLNNYEEWLVLYVDDELNEEDKIAVEKFAAAHNHVQQELALFQQAKLQPEKIVFSNKDVLYRKEKIAVISMQWWRVAVAAILIIAAGITVYSVWNKRNNNGSTPTDVVIKKELPSNPIKSITPNKQEQPAQGLKEEKEQITVTTPVTKELNKEKKKPGKQRDQGNSQQFASNELNNDQTGTRERFISQINNIQTTKPQINNAVAIEDKMHKENFNNEPVTTEDPESPNVRYIADNNGNKKFRGFFRKASRLIERTTNINPANDDNRVLIGGMAINLK